MIHWLGDNWSSLASIIGLAIGGVFALIQWHNSTQLKRSEFINQIIEKLRFNSEIAKAMYLVDYDQKWYDENFHGASEKELVIDKLLSYLSYICYLISENHLTKNESSILEYELIRACESLSVQAYLYNLYHFSKKRKSMCSFQYLIDYGLKLKIIPETFLEESSSAYPKYLNF
ncbi:MAG: hypothetical protein LBQ33_04210 [Oscillospiraceae bacterium]|jgi:hypothetical protein|nr:hypothetical protein [Oscillospiraceae bacterium]